MKSRETVLVTGAGGACGHFAVELALKYGYAVKATDLPGADFPFAGKRVSFLAGDLTDALFTRTLPEGVDHVIHAAVASRETTAWDTLRQINHEATAILWDRSVQEGVRTFVHLSTAAIYSKVEGKVRETDPLDPRGRFERSRFLAEKYLLRGAFSGRGPRLTILRPGLIMGPRARSMLAGSVTIPLVLKEYLGFCPRFIGGPNLSIAHARDVAAAALHFMERPGNGEAYNVSTAGTISLGELLNRLARLAGVRVVPVPVFLPKATVSAPISTLFLRPELLWVYAGIAERIWEGIRNRNRLAGSLVPIFDKATFDYVFRGVELSSERLLDTGFKPNFTTPESVLRDSISWYRNNTWLP